VAPLRPGEALTAAHAGRHGDRATRSRRARYTVVAIAAVLALAAAGTLAVLLGGSDDPRPAPATPPAQPGAGAPGAATASPTAALSAAEQRLADLLNPFRTKDCRSSPTGGVAGVDAALVCEADGVEAVRALHYVDAAALRRDVRRRSNAIEDVGKCADGEDSTEVWGRSTRRSGTLACFSDAGGAHLFWTVDADLLGHEVSGPDGAELVAWWRRFVS
jgi:hypothetical protein